ncbi:MAG TPA: serine--tRNA ligase, partial [Burkholderiaceae bacterium]|nr:serine--tRNA ligase [Burkholderiaceae bacterium]
MLDIASLRKDPAGMAARLRTRGFELDVAAFERLEAEHKSVQTRTEELQGLRNALSKQIGQLKSRGEDAADVMAEAARIPDEVKQLEQQTADVQARLQQFLMGVPNPPHESVPV